MAEEFLTKKMIDKNQLFKPKLNWGGLNNLPTWNFTETYYSVEDVKRNYLVRTSLDDKQLVVDSDDIQAEETIEWNLTIQAPPIIDADMKAKSVKISGHLGTIFYSFYEDDINHSSSIDFLDLTFHELTNNKYEFDPIFVIAARTSEDLSGFVSVDDSGRDLTLIYKLANGSTVTYTGQNIFITSKVGNITITPNIAIVDPPSEGGGDDDGSTTADVYLRYDFRLLNGVYYEPQFSPVWYSTTDSTSMGNKVEFTGPIPRIISNRIASIDEHLGLMDTKQSLYLWNSAFNCGDALVSMTPSHDNGVMLYNGLTSYAEKKTPLYDPITNRYVITLYITASSLPNTDIIK